MKKLKNITNLQEDLQDFIDERLNEIYATLTKDTEYSEKKKECDSLIEKLNSNFNKELFELYRDKNNSMQYIELKQAYLTGFKDSNIIFNN